MPKYVYRCKECEKVFEKIHSMSERLTDCESCNTIGSLLKVPTSPSIQYKDDNAGKVVKEYIENAKEELLAEKEALKKQEIEK